MHSTATTTNVKNNSRQICFVDIVFALDLNKSTSPHCECLWYHSWDAMWNERKILAQIFDLWFDRFRCYLCLDQREMKWIKHSDERLVHICTCMSVVYSVKLDDCVSHTRWFSIARGDRTSYKIAINSNCLMIENPCLVRVKLVE